MKKHLPIPRPINPKQVADDALRRARCALGQWSAASTPTSKSTRAIVRRRNGVVQARSRSAVNAYQGNQAPKPEAPMGLYISTLA
ncbi:MAG: hypothetical protein ACLFVH_13030 [Phycisphaerae bacterium]